MIQSRIYRVVRRMGVAFVMAMVLMASTVQADSSSKDHNANHQKAHDQKVKGKKADKRTKDCSFGLLVWCFTYTSLSPDIKTFAPIEIDLYGAWKFTNLYYKDEQKACTDSGCTLDNGGFSKGFAINYRLKGNGRSDQDFAIGLAVSTMPVVSGFENNKGFSGPFGTVAAGNGSLEYTNIRLVLKRRHFLYLIKSKYLISSFGVGMAIPQGEQAAGKSFTGSSGMQITIGGRLGAQMPITERVDLGVVSHWGVWWYGDEFLDSAFMSSYGLQLSARL